MKKNIVLIQGALDIEINYLLSKMNNKVKKEISGFESLRVAFPDACIATRTVVQYIKTK